jgi:hypothetical protein
MEEHEGTVDLKLLRVEVLEGVDAGTLQDSVNAFLESVSYSDLSRSDTLVSIQFYEVSGSYVCAISYISSEGTIP